MGKWESEEIRMKITCLVRRRPLRVHRSLLATTLIPGTALVMNGLAECNTPLHRRSSSKGGLPKRISESLVDKSIPRTLKLLSYLCRLEYLGRGLDGTGWLSFARTPVFMIVSALWIVF